MNHYLQWTLTSKVPPISGKLGISHISKLSTALIHPSCWPRCSLLPAPTIMTTEREPDSKLESVPKLLRLPSIEEACEDPRKDSSPGHWSFIVSPNSFHLPLPPIILIFWRVGSFEDKKTSRFSQGEWGPLL